MWLHCRTMLFPGIQHIRRHVTDTLCYHVNSTQYRYPVCVLPLTNNWFMTNVIGLLATFLYYLHYRRQPIKPITFVMNQLLVKGITQTGSSGFSKGGAKLTQWQMRHPFIMGHMYGSTRLYKFLLTPPIFFSEDQKK